MLIQPVLDGLRKTLDPRHLWGETERQWAWQHAAVAWRMESAGDVQEWRPFSLQRHSCISSLVVAIGYSDYVLASVGQH